MKKIKIIFAAILLLSFLYAGTGCKRQKGVVPCPSFSLEIVQR